MDKIYNNTPTIQSFTGRLFKYYFENEKFPKNVTVFGIGKGRPADPVRMELIKKHVTDILGAEPHSYLWTQCAQRMHNALNFIRKKQLKKQKLLKKRNNSRYK